MLHNQKTLNVNPPYINADPLRNKKKRLIQKHIATVASFAMTF